MEDFCTQSNFDKETNNIARQVANNLRFGNPAVAEKQIAKFNETHDQSGQQALLDAAYCKGAPDMKLKDIGDNKQQAELDLTPEIYANKATTRLIVNGKLALDEIAKEAGDKLTDDQRAAFVNDLNERNKRLGLPFTASFNPTDKSVSLENKSPR